MSYEAKVKLPKNFNAQDYRADKQIKDINAAALAIKATQLTPSIDVIRDAARLHKDIGKIVSVTRPNYNELLMKHLEVSKSAETLHTFSATNILKNAQGESLSKYLIAKNKEFSSLYKMNDAIATIIKYQKEYGDKTSGPISEDSMAKIRSLAEAQKDIKELIKNNEDELSALKSHTLLLTYNRNEQSIWKKLTNWLSKGKEDFYRKSLNDAFAKSFENITKALQEEKASK